LGLVSKVVITPSRVARPICVPVEVVTPGTVGGALALNVVLRLNGGRPAMTGTLKVVLGLLPPVKLTVSVKVMVSGLRTLPARLKENGVMPTALPPAGMFG